jgi:carboxyl-terminal processing protease
MLWMLTLLASLAFAQDTVQDVYTVLSKQYEASLLERAAIEGMLDIVDQQAGLNGSTVLSHAEFTDWKAWKKGERDGFGLRVQVVAGRGFIVEHVMNNSPASEAGLLASDFIVSVNTRPLNGLSANQMLSVLETEGVERLILEVIRGDVLQTIKMKRGDFAVPQVEYHESSSTVEVQFFGVGSSEQIRETLLNPSSPSILDLRDNQGGLWEEAIATLDIFFPQESIVAYRQHHDGTKIPILSQESILRVEPLVILINQGTQGPAELVALTLQEHGMATLVGERTFGNGVDYHVLYPNSEWVLLMADTQLLSSKKQQWHGTGVVPNLSISAQQTYRGEDRQLQTALQLISSTP